MSKPHWNSIDFSPWDRDLISVRVNNFSEGPVILELEGGYHEPDLSEWMTPAQARELAAKLIEAADSADRAGKFVDQQTQQKEG